MCLRWQNLCCWWKVLGILSDQRFERKCWNIQVSSQSLIRHSKAIWNLYGFLSDPKDSTKVFIVVGHKIKYFIQRKAAADSSEFAFIAQKGNQKVKKTVLHLLNYWTAIEFENNFRSLKSRASKFTCDCTADKRSIPNDRRCCALSSPSRTLEWLCCKPHKILCCRTASSNLSCTALNFLSCRVSNRLHPIDNHSSRTLSNLHATASRVHVTEIDPECAFHIQRIID